MSAISLTVTPESFQLVPRLSEDCTIQLSNISFAPVMFQMRTTAPDRYLVKPSKGIISPNMTECICVSLRSAVEESSTDDFRIDYCALPADAVVSSRCANVPDLIRSVPKSERLHKIVKCTVQLMAAEEFARSARAKHSHSDSIGSSADTPKNSISSGSRRLSQELRNDALSPPVVPLDDGTMRPSGAGAQGHLPSSLPSGATDPTLSTPTRPTRADTPKAPVTHAGAIRMVMRGYYFMAAVAVAVALVAFLYS